MENSSFLCPLGLLNLLLLKIRWAIIILSHSTHFLGTGNSSCDDKMCVQCSEPEFIDTALHQSVFMKENIRATLL